MTEQAGTVLVVDEAKSAADSKGTKRQALMDLSGDVIHSAKIPQLHHSEVST